jgi:aminoglycoside phosphotransferase (APT) family kinase protein
MEICTLPTSLVHRGSISTVIDFGDITSGDASTDLSVAWKTTRPAEI